MAEDPKRYGDNPKTPVGWDYKAIQQDILDVFADIKAAREADPNADLSNFVTTLFILMNEYSKHKVGAQSDVEGTMSDSAAVLGEAWNAFYAGKADDATLNGLTGSDDWKKGCPESAKLIEKLTELKASWDDPNNTNLDPGIKRQLSGTVTNLLNELKSNDCNLGKIWQLYNGLSPYVTDEVKGLITKVTDYKKEYDKLILEKTTNEKNRLLNIFRDFIKNEKNQNDENQRDLSRDDLYRLETAFNALDKSSGNVDELFKDIRNFEKVVASLPTVRTGTNGQLISSKNVMGLQQQTFPDVYAAEEGPETMRSAAVAAIEKLKKYGQDSSAMIRMVLDNAGVQAKLDKLNKATSDKEIIDAINDLKKAIDSISDDNMIYFDKKALNDAKSDMTNAVNKGNQKNPVLHNPQIEAVRKLLEEEALRPADKKELSQQEYDTLKRAYDKVVEMFMPYEDNGNTYTHSLSERFTAMKDLETVVGALPDHSSMGSQPANKGVRALQDLFFPSAAKTRDELVTSLQDWINIVNKDGPQELRNVIATYNLQSRVDNLKKAGTTRDIVSLMNELKRTTDSLPTSVPGPNGNMIDLRGIPGIKTQVSDAVAGLSTQVSNLEGNGGLKKVQKFIDQSKQLEAHMQALDLLLKNPNMRISDILERLNSLEEFLNSMDTDNNGGLNDFRKSTIDKLHDVKNHITSDSTNKTNSAPMDSMMRSLTQLDQQLTGQSASISAVTKAEVKKYEATTEALNNVFHNCQMFKDTLVKAQRTQ